MLMNRAGDLGGCADRSNDDFEGERYRFEDGTVQAWRCNRGGAEQVDAGIGRKRRTVHLHRYDRCRQNQNKYAIQTSIEIRASPGLSDFPDHGSPPWDAA